LPFTVTARDATEAIARAIKEYDIPERERFRISVQRGAQDGRLRNGAAQS
jgi:hypothetical protein